MKNYAKVLLCNVTIVTFLLLAYGSGDNERSNQDSKSNKDSNVTTKEELVPCCCCDGGNKVVYYGSTYDYMGNPSGTDYDNPEPCPCCGAMVGDYESAQLTKSKSEEIKRETNHCK